MKNYNDSKRNENLVRFRKISTEITASPLDWMEHPFYAQKNLLISLLAELFAMPLLLILSRFMNDCEKAAVKLPLIFSLIFLSFVLEIKNENIPTFNFNYDF